MNSRGSALLGLQEPRIRVRPKKAIDFEDGEDAVFLSGGYGLTPDEWQGAVTYGWLARGKDGKLAAGRCGLAVPRQNGKNGNVEVVQLHKMAIQGRKLLHTAHEVKTARKAFLRLISFFENPRKYPELAEMVKEIRRTNGQEAIVLHARECERGDLCDCTGGASCEFVARSRGSGRGYTVDDLFCDEAQEMTDEQLEALLPTIAAAPSGDPQIIFLGTPPGPNSPGEVFERIRKDALQPNAKRIAWDEWSIPDDMRPEDAVKQWRELAYETNPALGKRLRITTVQDELQAMSPEGFCRERLGQWSTRGGRAKAVSPSAWGALRGTKPADAIMSYGVKFTIDGSGVALAAAWKPRNGPVFIEPIEQRNLGEGTQWLIDQIVADAPSTAVVVVDGKGHAGFFVNALREAGMRNRKQIIRPTLDEVLAAHSMTEQAILTGGLQHPNDPDFNDQVLAAVKRKIGNAGGFGWEAEEGETVVAFDAATLAYFGAKTTKRRPGRGSLGMVM
ncbi:hypothetical protein MUN78_10240 [Leucobacter allii]|uniref:Terminase n=1 Tax=Leucobacter allii TaxID=2932247 RepID=A0ABY4FHV5_9MICO|nr:hypothetical protein [Leucobacter allii]UOQ56083.1 hypothetical protein MUN78_10240 [Leucobacter allii]